MPQIPFRYYMLGFRDFVMRENLTDYKLLTRQVVLSALSLEKLEKQPGYILQIMPRLLPAVRHVAMNQASFEASESIYGSFPEMLRRIEGL
jgi:hypothetical protein